MTGENSVSIEYPLVCSSWGDEEIYAIQSVIERNQYSMSDAVAMFEESFAKKVGSTYAVMVNSGSSANLLAINALMYKQKGPLKQGDEVIVPSVSWSTTYFPVSQCGMRLVFVDINRETLNIDVEQLEKALTDSVKAVFVPNILGNPAQLNVLKSFCDKHNLYLIEDNCESMGASLGGKQAGTFGICGTFSTYFSHHMSTMEGGVVVTDNEELYHILLCMRSHGWTRHLPESNRLCKKNSDDFFDTFRFILPGYNLRPIEMMGAIGLVQLDKLDKFIDMRRQNAQKFIDCFGKSSKFGIQKETGKSSWFGFSILINDNTVSRNEVIKKLRENQVEVRPIVTGNFLRSEALKFLKYRVVGEHKEADYIHEYGFFIGNHHIDMTSRIELVANLLS